MSAPNTTRSGLRVGIVGARRVRQGLGPFVARDLVRLGAEVVAVLGTSEASAAEAAEQVERTAGVRPEALVDASAFDSLELDVACVLTPAGTHLEHVERALDAGRHVLCEKPFLWTPETDWSTRARDLEDRFAAAGLVLAVNAQWPWVLPAFEELTGQVLADASSLAMGLAPASLGARMIGDALPHPLSVAQALRPDLETIGDIRFEHPRPNILRVEAALEGPRGTFALDVRLDGAAEALPREAWLEIDGVRADRCVRVADYAMFLRSGARLVDMPDPLEARLRAFVESVQAADGRPREPGREISRRAGMLANLVSAFPGEDP